MALTLNTANLRVSTGLANKIDEIARLTKTKASIVCDRLFADAVERELREVRDRELARLQTEKQSS